eukprot:SAG22_NODE_138_length_18031_cov_5.796621_22_plen_63_part_00
MVSLNDLATSSDQQPVSLSRCRILYTSRSPPSANFSTCRQTCTGRGQTFHWPLCTGSRGSTW